MRVREELLKIENGFGSASGVIYEKIIYIVALEDEIIGEKEWEFTYSPSMGSSNSEILESLQSVFLGYQLKIKKSSVVENHLKWIEWLKYNFIEYHVKNQKVLKGIQHGLTTNCLEVQSGLDFLRVKADHNVPSWVLKIKSKLSILIIDYNGSGSEESINKDIKLIKEKHPYTELYLEQPFNDMSNFKRNEDVNYIFDTKNIQLLIECSIIRENDIVILKLGRNTPDEYCALRSKGANICFGNVNSGIIGDRICEKVSENLSTLYLKIT